MGKKYKRFNKKKKQQHLKMREKKINFKIPTGKNEYPKLTGRCTYLLFVCIAYFYQHISFQCSIKYLYLFTYWTEGKKLHKMWRTFNQEGLFCSAVGLCHFFMYAVNFTKYTICNVKSIRWEGSGIQWTILYLQERSEVFVGL